MERIGIYCGLLLAAACGVVQQGNNNDDAAVEIDAAVDGPTVDAPPAGRCDPTAPFRDPARVEELNTSSDDGNARLTPDELTVYFASDRPGGNGSLDVYIARRDSVDQPFEPPELLPGYNTTGLEDAPTLPADELTIYTLGNASSDLFFATRDSTDEDFGPPILLDALSSSDTETEPYVLPDHSATYFPRNDNGSFRLFRAARDGATFADPVPLEGINVDDPSAVDAAPVVTGDELTLYFLSDRADGVGSFDIWIATRPDRNAAFSEPVNLTELNTAGRDQPTWISPDGCVLYFVSATANDGNDIFVATRGR